MESNPTPLTIKLSYLVLGLTAGLALPLVSLAYGPLNAIGLVEAAAAAALYVLVPVYAIAGLSRRTTGGRYLTYLSLLCTSAVLMRGFLNFIAARPVRGKAGEFIAMCILGLATICAGVMFAMLYRSDVDEYFSTNEAEDVLGKQAERQIARSPASVVSDFVKSVECVRN